MSEVSEAQAYAVVAQFLETVAGQGTQVLLELAVTPGLNPAIRLNAALALVGLPELMVEAYYGEEPDEVGPAEAEEFPMYGGEPDVQGDSQPEADPVEETAAGGLSEREKEEIFARLQVADSPHEPGEGAGSLGGASGLGRRNPKAARRRRKHGR